MRNPKITVTTTESVYFLTLHEYSRVIQYGLVDYLGAEEIVSVEGEMEVDLEWMKEGF